MRYSIIATICISLLVLANGCKTSTAGLNLVTNSSFTFSGHSYNNLSVVSSGTKPYIITASPITMNATVLTMTFSRGNPAIGSYSTTPTESNSCVMSYSSIVDKEVITYVSVIGTVSVAANDTNRKVIFTNVTMVNSVNPTDTKVVSGTVLF